MSRRYQGYGTVSIHAPTRGATCRSRGVCMPDKVSIHAPTRGATSCPSRHCLFLLFQSTPPRGGRLMGSGVAWLFHRFNPRPHAGGDLETLAQGTTKAKVSIHAPTRGATRLSRRYQGYGTVSIHAPTRGATCRSRGVCMPDKVSIHAPTRGATSCPSRHCLFLLFQSTPPRGGRLMGSGVAWLFHRFNPRPHAGGDLETLAQGTTKAKVSIHAPTRGATLNNPLH